MTPTTRTRRDPGPRLSGRRSAAVSSRNAFLGLESVRGESAGRRAPKNATAIETMRLRKSRLHVVVNRANQRTDRAQSNDRHDRDERRQQRVLDHVLSIVFPKERVHAMP